jgi:Flp pilus assembly protein TadG
MMVPVFVLIAGLVFDGGNTIAMRRRVVDEAQSAARAGAEQLALALHEGGFVLDVPQAVAAAQAVLAQAGLAGGVEVNGDVVTVTVHTTYHSVLLPTSFDVVGTGTAEPVRGVTRAVGGG